MLLDDIHSIYIVKKLNDHSEHIVNVANTISNYFLKKYNIGEVPIHYISNRTLIISIGGDGTMLFSARIASQNDCYVVGFNLGKLGFITTDIVEGNVISTLEELIHNSVVQERLLLTLGDNAVAMNEFLFQPRGIGLPLHKFSLYNKEQLITHYNASGLMISTPTGSTGFAVSLGGAIIDPSVRAIEVLPLAAHSLMQGSHPIILPDTVELTIKTEHNEIDVIADGRLVETEVPLPMTVRVAPKPAKFVNIGDWNFFDVLVQKMGWK